MPFDIDQRELLTWTINIGKAALILLVGFIVGRLVRTWLLKLGLRRGLAVNVVALLANLLQIAIVVFSAILILPTFGVDWTALLTLVGTAGLAISLAAQDLLRNFIAGIYILIEQPFKIGDKIKLEAGGGVSGTVQSIELRVTNLRTDKGEQVIVPNNVIFSNVVINGSASNLQRKIIDISVPVMSVDEASTRIADTLRQVEDVATAPAPAVTVESLTAEELKLQVTFWAPQETQASVMRRSLMALRDAFPGAEITVGE